MRGDAAQLAGREVRDDDDLAAKDLLGLVRLGDSGHDGARLGLADIDLEVEQLIGAFDGLGGEDQADAEIDFGEVVDIGRPVELDPAKLLWSLIVDGFDVRDVARFKEALQNVQKMAKKYGA